MRGRYRLRHQLRWELRLELGLDWRVECRQRRLGARLQRGRLARRDGGLAGLALLIRVDVKAAARTS